MPPEPQAEPQPELDPEEVYPYLQGLLRDARALAAEGKEAEANELYEQIKGLEHGLDGVDK